MSKLVNLAADHAEKKLQLSHNILIDAIQIIRNEYTHGEVMSDKIERKIEIAFGELQKGRNWVQAIAEED